VNYKTSFGWKTKTQEDSKQYIKDLMKIAFKYKDQPIFSKFPYLASFESDLERWLFGLDIKTENPQLRDFLSKCLEVTIFLRITISSIT